jgi:hypothetical protein
VTRAHLIHLWRRHHRHHDTAEDAESVGRINVALSLLHHRPPSPHTIRLAVRALQGASLEALVELDRERAA